MRAMKRCSLKPKDRVKIKGTPFTAVIEEIVADERQVNWDGMFPKYIHIVTEGDGKHMMAHHSQLKRVVKVT